MIGKQTNKLNWEANKDIIEQSNQSMVRMVTMIKSIIYGIMLIVRFVLSGYQYIRLIYILPFSISLLLLLASPIFKKYKSCIKSRWINAFTLY